MNRPTRAQAFDWIGRTGTALLAAALAVLLLRAAVSGNWPQVAIVVASLAFFGCCWWLHVRVQHLLTVAESAVNHSTHAVRSAEHAAKRLDAIVARDEGEGRHARRLS